jgi:hypothetical protein
LARKDKKINAYRFLVGKPQGKKLHETSRFRFVVNIKMGIVEMG